jgi:hypothetical protein
MRLWPLLSIVFGLFGPKWRLTCRYFDGTCWNLDRFVLADDSYAYLIALNLCSAFIVIQFPTKRGFAGLHVVAVV